MAAAAQVLTEFPTIRRFELPDMDRHPWIVPRLVQAFPHLNERAAVGWVRDILYSNEYSFLYCEHGVACAQLISGSALAPKPIVREQFVWAENKEDKAQLEAASYFYVEFLRWAKRQNADPLIVEENSDIPHELVKERLGRIFTRQQQFARI